MCFKQCPQSATCLHVDSELFTTHMNSFRGVRSCTVSTLVHTSVVHKQWVLLLLRVVDIHVSNHLRATEADSCSDSPLFVCSFLLPGILTCKSPPPLLLLLLSFLSVFQSPFIPPPPSQCFCSCCGYTVSSRNN